MLLSEAIEIYLLRPNLAENTRASYFIQFDLFLRWFGDKPLNEVRHVDCLRYFAERAKHCKVGTYNTNVNIFKTMFRWMRRCGYISDNPMELIETLRSPENDEKGMSQAHWLKLREYLKAWSIRDYAMYAFLADTACRVSAAAALKLENLDLEACKAMVYEAKIRQWCEVDYSFETRQALIDWLDVRVAAHDYVFSQEKQPHRALKPHSIRELLKRKCVEIGLPPYTPHSLRHMTLQHFSQQEGVTLLDVQTKANHLSGTTTLRSYFAKRSKRVAALTQQFSLVSSPLKIEE